MIDSTPALQGYCGAAAGHPFHGPYHDKEYGFPVTSGDRLFGRLVLEINQAGLSWLTILKKWDTFEQAYDNFDVATVASYGDADRARLLADPGVIRNRLKVDAAIHNASCILEIRDSHGSFSGWLETHHRGQSSIGLSSSSRRSAIHGRRDHRRISDEHRLSAGCARPQLSRLRPHSRSRSTMDAIRRRGIR